MRLKIFLLLLLAPAALAAQDPGWVYFPGYTVMNEDVPLVPFKLKSGAWAYVDQQMNIVAPGPFPFGNFFTGDGTVVVDLDSTSAFLTAEGKIILPYCNGKINLRLLPHGYLFYPYVNNTGIPGASRFGHGELILDNGKMAFYGNCFPCQHHTNTTPSVLASEFRVICRHLPPELRSSFIPGLQTAGFLRMEDPVAIPQDADHQNYLLGDRFSYVDRITGLSGIKNSKGEILLPAVYQSIRCPLVYDPPPVSFPDDFLVATGPDNKSGIIRYSGDTLIPFRLQVFSGQKNMITAQELVLHPDSAGKLPDRKSIRMEDQGKTFHYNYYYYDWEGKLLMGPTGSPSPFSLYPAQPSVDYTKTPPQLVTAAGKIIEVPGCTYMGMEANQAFVGIAGARGAGLMDTTGKIILPMKFNKITRTGANTFQVLPNISEKKINKSGFYPIGYADADGHFFIPIGKGISYLSEDRFVVKGKRDGWQVVNRKGELIANLPGPDILGYIKAGENEYFRTASGWMDKSGRKFWEQ